jgi:hypothetical protein
MGHPIKGWSRTGRITAGGIVNKVGKVLALSMAATAVLGLFAAPAQAGWWECPDGNICFWTDQDFYGQRLTLNGDGNNWQRSNLANDQMNGGQGADNVITSVINRTGSTWCLYDGKNFDSGNGTGFTRVTAWEWINTLGDQRHHFDNRASSIMRQSGCDA